MSIPVKYLFVEYRTLRLPLLFTAPFNHAEFSDLHPVKSAGYAKRVSPLGVQAYDRSTTLDLDPEENDSLRLSAILSGRSGPLNYVMLEREGEPWPVVTLLPLMELAKMTTVRQCNGGSDSFGTLTVIERGLGFMMRPHCLILERGESEPGLPVESALNFWLREVLEVAS